MNLAEIALRLGRDPARADRNAFLSAQGPISNAEFQRLVFAIVGDLLSAGTRPGEKILLRMTNSVEFAAAFLAAIWIGAIPVLQNSQFGKGELEPIVTLSDPKIFLLSESLHDDPALAGLRPDAPRFVVTRAGLIDQSGRKRDVISTTPPAAFDTDRNTAALIVFTSGTTGRPKGIVHAHRWLEALGDSNRARVPPQPNDVILATGDGDFVPLVATTYSSLLATARSVRSWKTAPAPSAFYKRSSVTA
jgi:acyl-coenzyme A synthetase/AMP-(fatty) acid ligase